MLFWLKDNVKNCGVETWVQVLPCFAISLLVQELSQVWGWAPGFSIKGSRGAGGGCCEHWQQWWSSVSVALFGFVAGPCCCVGCSSLEIFLRVSPRPQGLKWFSFGKRWEIVSEVLRVSCQCPEQKHSLMKYCSAASESSFGLCSALAPQRGSGLSGLWGQEVTVLYLLVLLSRSGHRCAFSKISL